jgi:ATP-dependent 26S proteasome regulatory subunit
VAYPTAGMIEDVDLIARDRGTMYGPGDLNEMDGLREDAAVLFILTTNRPANLERALASRPGRIDQAIEFPRYLTTTDDGCLYVSTPADSLWMRMSWK